jgi:hypothetical protein
MNQIPLYPVGSIVTYKGGYFLASNLVYIVKIRFHPVYEKFMYFHMNEHGIYKELEYSFEEMYAPARWIGNQMNDFKSILESFLKEEHKDIYPNLHPVHWDNFPLFLFNREEIKEIRVKKMMREAYNLVQ